MYEQWIATTLQWAAMVEMLSSAILISKNNRCVKIRVGLGKLGFCDSYSVGLGS